MLIYQREFRKTVDDTVFEVDCALITVKAGADVDIGAVDSQTRIPVFVTDPGQVPIPLLRSRRRLSRTEPRKLIMSSTPSDSRPPRSTRSLI